MNKPQFHAPGPLLCIMCHRAPGSGSWGLCPACRRQLIEQSAARQSRMAPSYCLGCLTPKRGTPVAGSIYCPRCDYRFNGKAAKSSA